MNHLSADLSELMLNSNKGVGLRRITSEDRDILLRIYASTRVDELAQTDWTEFQKNIFIKSQFEAQDVHYKKYYGDAHFCLILVNGVVAGRLYLLIKSDEIRIIDISLLPEFRNQGIGSDLFHDIQALGTRESLDVYIHVEQYNPALQLYKRLGFKEVEQVGGIYYLMKWSFADGK